MNMRKPLLLAFAVLVVNTHLGHADDPVYEGKPASFWIKRLADSFVPNEIFGRPSREAPMHALRSIGRAAVPAMIEALKDESGYVRQAAAYALGEFRADAKAAVPALVEAIRSGRLDAQAGDTLEQIGPAAPAAIPELAGSLTHENALIRINMAYALAKLDPDNTAAIDCLVAALRNKTGGRPAAARALGNLGPRAKRAVPALITLLKDPDYELPTQAAYTLGRIGPAAKAAAAPLAAALAGSQDQYLCQAAGQSLVEMGPDAIEAVPTLIEIVKSGGLHQSPWPRPAALRALNGIGAAAVPHLAALLDQASPILKAQVIASIGRFGSRASGAVPAMTAELKDEHTAVRSAAASALGSIGSGAKSAAPTLTEAVKDKAAAVRVNAAMALVKINGDVTVAVPILVAILQNRGPGWEAEQALARRTAETAASTRQLSDDLERFGDASVRLAAVGGLGEIGAGANLAIPVLLESLADSEYRLVQAAAGVLAKLGPQIRRAAVLRLVEALKQENARVRSNAASTLAGIDIDPELPVVVALIELLGEKNENVRQAAAYALARIGRQPLAVSVLVKALKNPKANVRREAAALVGRAGAKAKEAVEPLAELLRDEDSRVSKAAAGSLIKIDADAAARLGVHRFHIEDLRPARARGPGSVATVRWVGLQGPKESGTFTEARLLRFESRLQHSDRITCVTFSSNGKHLASASLDGSVVLWSVAAEREVRIFAGHAQGASCVAFSPDGKVLASGARDGTLHIWSVETGRLLHSLKVAEDLKPNPTTGRQPPTVRTVAFSPNAKRLAAACQGSTAVYDVATGRELFRMREEEIGSLQLRREVWSVAWAPDGTILATVNAEGGVTIWSASDAKQIRTLAEANGANWSQAGLGSPAIAFSPNSQAVAAVVFNVVKIWSMETGEVQRTITPNRSFVGSLAFSADGKTLAAGCNGAVLFWSTDTGEKRNAHETGDNESVLSVALSPDGKSFAYAHSGLFNTVELRPLGEARYAAQAGFVLDAKVSPDRKTIGTASMRLEAASRVRGVLRLWSAETGEPIHQIVAGEGTIFGAFAFSPDSQSLVCATRDADTGDSIVSTVEVQTGRELHTATGRAMMLTCSPDGKLLAGSGADLQNPDNTIRFWSTQTLEPMRTLTSQQEVIHSLAFSPNGRVLGSGGSDGTVKLWSIESGEELLTFAGHVPDRKGTTRRPAVTPVHQLAFSPDGKTVGSACGIQVKLWSAETGRELHDLVNESTRSLTAVPSVVVFGGQRFSHASLSFSPDGRTIVTVGPDRRLGLWDLSSGRELSSLYLPYAASLLDVSRDGRSLATWNANGSCYILTTPFAD